MQYVSGSKTKIVDIRHGFAIATDRHLVGIQDLIASRRLSGLRVSLALQDNVHGPLRRYEFHTFVSQSPQVYPFE